MSKAEWTKFKAGIDRIGNISMRRAAKSLHDRWLNGIICEEEMRLTVEGIIIEWNKIKIVHQ